MANIAPPPEIFLKFYHIASNLQSSQLTTGGGGGGGGEISHVHSKYRRLKQD